MQPTSSNLKNVLTESLCCNGQAVAIFSPNDVLLFANETFRNLFKVDNHTDSPNFESIMRNCFINREGLIINTDDFEIWISNVQQKRLSSSKRVFESDFHDGTWMLVNETIDNEGYVCFIGSSITHLKNNERILKVDRDQALKASNTDPLTGLYNRRFLNGYLAEAIERSRGENSFVACLLDIDKFKLINDTYGHLVGDCVLQHFATVARKVLRPDDVLSRIGGEEFFLLLPQTDGEGATHVLNRLRHSINESLAYPEVPTLTYSFSAGISQIASGDTVEKVLKRTDDALYCAKNNGRNCNVQM